VPEVAAAGQGRLLGDGKAWEARKASTARGVCHLKVIS
jgi:hypothetical protein